MGALNLNVQNLHSDQSIPYTMLYTRNSDVAFCRFALLTAVLRSARSLTVTFALIAVTMLVALPLAHIARGVLISSLCSRAQSIRPHARGLSESERARSPCPEGPIRGCPDRSHSRNGPAKVAPSPLGILHVPCTSAPPKTCVEAHPHGCTHYTTARVAHA